MPDTEERVNILEKELAQIKGRQQASRIWAGIFGVIILGWLGITSFVSIPKAVDKWIVDQGIDKTIQEINGFKDDAEKAKEDTKEAKMKAIQEKNEIIRIKRGLSSDLEGIQGKVLQIVFFPIQNENYTSEKRNSFDTLLSFKMKPRKANSKLVVSITGTVGSVFDFDTVGDPHWICHLRIKHGNNIVAATALHFEGNKSNAYPPKFISYYLPFHMEGEYLCNSNEELTFNLQLLQRKGTTAHIASNINYMDEQEGKKITFKGGVKIIEIAQ